MPKTSIHGQTIKVDLESDAPGLNKDELEAFLEEGRGGFTGEEISDAFDLVKDAEHWKNPIDAIIPAGKQAVVERAIPWYTGTEAAFEECDRAGYLRVTAPGYFAGPCN